MAPPVLTKQQQINEIIKCGKDAEYFMKNYCYIQHPIKGLIPFKTYPFQDECVKAFQKHRFNVILKSRQLGLSTVIAAYAVWMAIFQKDKNILVIATKLPTAKNFIKKVTVILNSLPKWLLLPSYVPTLQQVTFNNGSQIKAIPTSADAGRSEALSLLIVDEAAFIRNFDEIWTGIYPTISTGGRVIVNSTPNGTGGQYYKIYVEAEAGINDFNPIKLPWYVHPERDDEWFEKETRNLSKRKVAQEYLCDFVSSGDTFLNPNTLEHVRSMIKKPEKRDGYDNNIWVWEDPKHGCEYVISGDVARGDARDYSAFHVIDSKECKVVAEYMGKAPPEKLADMLFEWGKKYNNAFIAVENNTFGYFVNVKLRDNGYSKLYYHHNDGNPFEYIAKPDELPGFQTNQKSRTQILAKLEELLRNQKLLVHSQRLYDQLQAFIRNGDKPVAAKDSYDDLIMSLAIGCWVIEGNNNNSTKSYDMAKAMLESTKVVSRTMEYLPIYSSVGVQFYGTTPNNIMKPKEIVAPLTGRELLDFSWVFK